MHKRKVKEMASKPKTDQENQETHEPDLSELVILPAPEDSQDNPEQEEAPEKEQGTHARRGTYSAAPQFADTQGNLYNIPGAVPVAGTGGATLVIPSGASNSGVLDNSAIWKATKDAGTPGTVSTTFNKFIDSSHGRQFNATYANHAGMRWSNHFHNDVKPTNFVYDLTWMTSSPNDNQQLELDMNHSLANGENIFLCTQANFTSGYWDYTLSDSSGNLHWHRSTMKVDPVLRTANVWTRIRIKTSHDANGVVTYEGVEINGKYTLFDPSCKGPAEKLVHWTVGCLLNNYQTNGKQTNGTMNTFARQMVIFYW